MAISVVRIPLRKRILHGTTVFELPVTLEVRTASSHFVPMPFVFDTGSHFSTIRITDAQALGIPFSTSQPVPMHAATGPSASAVFLSPFTFSFPNLPAWQFTRLGCFTPHPVKYSLLSLTDVIMNFALRTEPPTATCSEGALLLRLRRKHHGQPRP